MGFWDQDTFPMLPLLYPLPEGQKYDRKPTQRDRREAKKGASMLLLPPPERREVVSADSDDASPFWCSLGHPGHGNDLPRVGKTRDQTTPIQVRMNRVPRRMILKQTNQGAFPYRHPPDNPASCSWAPRPPLGKPSFGWGLQNSEEVASHPTRRAFFTEEEAPLWTGRPPLSALTRGGRANAAVGSTSVVREPMSRELREQGMPYFQRAGKKKIIPIFSTWLSTGCPRPGSSGSQGCQSLNACAAPRLFPGAGCFSSCSASHWNHSPNIDPSVVRRTST